MKTSPKQSAFRHASLLLPLFLLIFVQPFLSLSARPYVDEFLSISAYEAFLIFALTSGAYAVSTSRRQLVTTTSLLAAMVAIKILTVSREDEWGVLLYLALALVYFGVVTFALARPLLTPSDKVTSDTLVGALAIYLLIGVLWSIAYATLQFIEPGSFSFPPSPEGAPGTGNDSERFLGFSFTTLTTLGYGNIVPTTSRADALTSLEAIIGQIYLAVIVARLVAIQTSQERNEAPAEE